MSVAQGRRVESKLRALLQAAGDLDKLSLFSLVGFVDEGLVDVRNDTTARNGGLDESIKLFVSANGELQMARRDTLDLEILASVSGQFEYFSRQVFENGRGVDSRRRSHSLSMVNRVLEETVDTTDRELKPSFGRARLWGLFARGGLASFAALSSFAALARLKRRP